MLVGRLARLLARASFSGRCQPLAAFARQPWTAGCRFLTASTSADAAQTSQTAPVEVPDLLLCTLDSKSSVKEQFLNFQLQLARKSIQKDNPIRSNASRLLLVLQLVEKPEQVDVVVELLRLMQFHRLVHPPSVCAPIYQTFQRIGALDKCVEVFKDRQSYRLTPTKRIVEELLEYFVGQQDKARIAEVLGLLRAFNWFPSWKTVTLLLQIFPEHSDSLLAAALRDPPMAITSQFLETALFTSIQCKRADLAQLAWKNAVDSAKTAVASTYFAAAHLLTGDIDADKLSSLIKQPIDEKSIDELVAAFDKHWQERDPDLVSSMRRRCEQLKSMRT